ncbi:MAG: SpoIIE family protein phosphatase [Pseudomonadota bacterium]|nr:SpoIIE family protein phosphatase [Pseudomonadota bacterium]
MTSTMSPSTISPPQDEDESPVSVLLIDQAAEQQSHIASCLRDEDYQIEVVADAASGLEFWRRRRPQVVICDMAAPGSDGLNTLRTITGSDTGTQVIMISGAGDMDEVVRALRLGAVDFLLQPIANPEVLLHAVKRALDEYTMTAQNRHYREELERKNRELQDSLRLLKEDQEAARAVQLKMLPEPRKSYGPMEVAYRIIPSLYLSGDFIDYFRLGPNRIGFYLADVSGHGASSAFITVLLKTMANRVKQHYQDEQPTPLRPAQILEQANAELLPLGLGKHLAVFCGYVDCEQKKLVYCSAAHFPPPVLVTGGRTLTLEGSGLPVGLFEGVTYENQEVSLGDGFHLVIFSDGILELLPQSSVAEKERYLVEIVSQGIHNVDQIIEHLDLRTPDNVPDDIALMTVTCSPEGSG